MKNIEVVVVIATSMGRSDLLIERSLYSVYQQRAINPCCIYIVDDGDDEQEFFRLKERVKELHQHCFSSIFDGEIPQSYFHTRVIRNSRSRRRSGSGAWNCGALHAYRTYGKGRKNYLAILDDDDAWHADYLSRCVWEVNQSERYLAAIVCSFYRCEPDGNRLITVCKEQLIIDNFFIGNPGWQGSNTFVEMTAFWKAGGYDESLHSTHDRDFAIRFLEVCECNNYQIGAVSAPLMYHYVHSGERVTTCPERKNQGLDAFFRKYYFRMSESILSQALKRAERLFKYKYNIALESHDQLGTELRVQETYKDAKPINIVIGVVSSDSQNVRLQLDSIFRQLNIEPQFRGYCHYVVMTNGTDEESIKEVMANKRGYGLMLSCIDLAEQQAMLDRFPFSDDFVNESLERKSIAYSRSLLQFYCGNEAKNYGASCVVLILDDDLTFESLLIDGNQVKSVHLNFFGKVSYLRRESQADMLVSAYSDSPPLPFYSSMRTQFLDVLYTFRLFLNLDQSSLDLPDKIIQGSNYHQPDYYYDLSSAYYDHLEKPLAWLGVDRQKGLKGNAMLKAFLADFKYLVKEANITRPLLMDKQEWRSLTGDISSRRGGVAIYLNTHLLHEIPHLSPMFQCDGEMRRSRRSDFVSTIAKEKIFGKTVESTSFALRHNRRKQKSPCQISSNKLLDDVIGLCFYRTFKYFLDNPNASDMKLKSYFEHNVRESLGKMKINSLRILQLLTQLKSLLLSDSRLKGRADKDILLSNEVEEAIEVVNYIQREFAKRKFNEQLRSVKSSAQHFDLIGQINAIKSRYELYVKKNSPG